MSVYVQDSDFTLYQGDVLEVLSRMPADSIDCVVTSPPYWGLRDYGVDGQLGLEPTPEEFMSSMVAVFSEVKRVLAPHGTLWLNIGDSYAGKASGGWGDDSSTLRAGRLYQADRRRQEVRVNGSRDKLAPGLKPKDLVGIPWQLALALRADGWWLRRDVVWSKPNPMPEQVEDRPTTAHEYLFLLTKSERYFYDFVSVREPVSGNAHARGNGLNPKAAENTRAGGIKQNASFAAGVSELTARRNFRSVWEVASEPQSGAHFATFPTKLIEPCILAGSSSAGVCSECGSPWIPVNEKRSLERHELPHDHPAYRPARYEDKYEKAGLNGGGQRYLDVVTTGWKRSCAHTDAPSRPSRVLDPFMGSGTTAVVARRHGRHSVGIELNAVYCELAAQRLAQQSLLVEASA